MASKQAAEAAGDKTLATGLGNRSKFAAAIKATGLEGALDGPTPYTVLAPCNPAFDKLHAGALDTLMKPERRKDLIAMLPITSFPESCPPLISARRLMAAEEQPPSPRWVARR